jgi:hypothetical protein
VPVLGANEADTALVAAHHDSQLLGHLRRWPHGDEQPLNAQPPATAGMMLTVWPSGTSVFRPSR